jgi:hypothetical protein
MRFDYKKEPYQDIYVRVSEDGRVYHQCQLCWTRVDRTDNGFKPLFEADGVTRIEYPHADDCRARGSF